MLQGADVRHHDPGPSDQVRAGLEYTYIDATFREDAESIIAPGTDIPAGSRLTMVPDHKLVVTFEFEVARRWTLYLRDLYVSSQSLDGDDAGLADELPSYNLVDVWVRYRLKRWDAFLKVLNITNEEYSTRGITDGVQSFYTPAAERALLAGVTFRL